MIMDIYSPKEIARGIERLEDSLESLKRSNFCFKEKRDLREIYINQMKKYKEIQVSFYTEFTN
jgi:hypothetical protein